LVVNGAAVVFLVIRLSAAPDPVLRIVVGLFAVFVCPRIRAYAVAA
jgi:hypothetical protein